MDTHDTDWTDIADHFPDTPATPKPSEALIKTKLDDLAILQLDIETLRIENERAVNAVIPADIQEKIDAVNAEYAHKGTVMLEEQKRLDAEIRELILQFEGDVKGTRINAYYSAGKESWDTKGLKGYAKAHAEVLEFLKTGKPFVTIK